MLCTAMSSGPKGCHKTLPVDTWAVDSSSHSPWLEIPSVKQYFAGTYSTCSSHLQKVAPNAMTRIPPSSPLPHAHDLVLLQANLTRWIYHPVESIREYQHQEPLAKEKLQAGQGNVVQWEGCGLQSPLSPHIQSVTMINNNSHHLLNARYFSRCSICIDPILNEFGTIMIPIWGIMGKYSEEREAVRSQATSSRTQNEDANPRRHQRPHS